MLVYYYTLHRKKCVGCPYWFNYDTYVAIENILMRDIYPYLKVGTILCVCGGELIPSYINVSVLRIILNTETKHFVWWSYFI